MRVHCKNTIAISICSTPNSTFDKYTKLINHIASYLMSTLFHFHARYSFCQPFSNEPKNAQRTHTIQTASRYFFYSIFFCSFFRSASFAKLLLFIHLYQICCIYGLPIQQNITYFFRFCKYCIPFSANCSKIVWKRLDHKMLFSFFLLFAEQMCFNRSKFTFEMVVGRCWMVIQIKFY